ncbi:MAG: hypothetical protein INR72_13135, partial [Williamsia herbipolensis]|nr:hypothetical protein [Williamsia herbipolensis]
MTDGAPGGVPWIVGTRRVAESGGDDAITMAALVLGRGWVDTTIADGGLPPVVAATLRRELSRPLEAASGAVHQVRVDVEVGLEDTLVVVEGSAEAVLAAGHRLEDLLRRPEQIVFELPAEKDRIHGHPFGSWGVELAAWFGGGPATVLADTVAPWDGALDALHAALRALAPGAGVAAVGATTVPRVAQELFADVRGIDLAASANRPSALRWRHPTPGAVAGRTTHVLSARAPGGILGQVALRLLIDTVNRSFAVSHPIEGLAASAAVVDGARLVVLEAVAGRTPLDPGTCESVAATAVSAFAELSDDVLDVAVGELASDGVRAQYTGLVPGLLRTLRTGRTIDGAEIAAEIDAITRPALRAAIDELGHAVLLTGLQDDPPDRRVLSVVDVPIGTSPSKHVGRFPVESPAGPRFAGVEVSGPRLAQTFSPTRRDRAGDDRIVLDLRRVVARVDIGDDVTRLVDDTARQVALVWPALRRADRLRHIISEAVPAERTVRVPGDPAFASWLRSRGGRGR